MWQPRFQKDLYDIKLSILTEIAEYASTEGDEALTLRGGQHRFLILKTRLPC